eukprot:CAMPEP_0201491370 /NCGR_PEP_ID=MMETSP0151_2-20130828/29614_1 /ASSEMBLY_ACC=CAM_ASM_000257 /TAXON_ID=200890 /ORGANISM="Paramoeba atlantica, Strain 621/1 / CCAP 1560/9" /LENGTH=198 /DNA_ID=CAMNT_0047877699 /DNA_START=346 /DNA_END=942 /DNA_ORIENTATION=-
MSKKNYTFSGLSGKGEQWFGQIAKQGTIIEAPFVTSMFESDKAEQSEQILASEKRRTDLFTPSSAPPKNLQRKNSFLPDEDELQKILNDQENYARQFPEAGETDPLISRFNATYKKKMGDLFVSLSHVSFSSSAMFGKKFRVPLSYLKGVDMRQGNLMKSVLILKISAREEYQFEFKSDVDKAYRLISDLIEQSKLKT